MKYSSIVSLMLLSGWPVPALADAFVPPAQDRYFDLALEALQHEAPGLRLSAAYLMSMGLPSFVSKVGVDLGLQFFPGLSRPAPEYGFFIESAIHATASYTLLWKTGFHTLSFPEAEASESSLSTVGIELNLQWGKENTFWECGLGARYRDKDPERIEVGSEVIEKQWLVYPRIGIGILL